MHVVCLNNIGKIIQKKKKICRCCIDRKNHFYDLCTNFSVHFWQKVHSYSVMSKCSRIANIRLTVENALIKDLYFIDRRVLYWMVGNFRLHCGRKLRCPRNNRRKKVKLYKIGYSLPQNKVYRKISTIMIQFLYALFWGSDNNEIFLIFNLKEK